jgi:hypothetical protein
MGISPVLPLNGTAISDSKMYGLIGKKVQSDRLAVNGGAKKGHCH